MTLALVGVGSFVLGLIVGFVLRRRRLHLRLDVNGDEH